MTNKLASLLYFTLAAIDFLPFGSSGRLAHLAKTVGNLKSSELTQMSWVLCESGKRCYREPEDLGCFEIGPFSIWCHQEVLPESPETISPEFWLYTPDGHVQTFDFFHLNTTVKKLKLDPGKEFWLIVHGFGGWPKHWMSPVKDALVEKVLPARYGLPYILE